MGLDIVPPIGNVVVVKVFAIAVMTNANLTPGSELRISQDKRHYGERTSQQACLRSLQPLYPTKQSVVELGKRRTNCIKDKGEKEREVRQLTKKQDCVPVENVGSFDRSHHRLRSSVFYQNRE